MTKAEFIDQIAEKTGLSKRAAADAVDAFLTTVEDALKKGAYPCIATHDERMILGALRIVQSRKIDPRKFEFQMLYGIRQDLQRKLAEQGYQVRVYTPYGPHWYPYFMRRLAERPANLWFFLRSAAR